MRKRLDLLPTLLLAVLVPLCASAQAPEEAARVPVTRFQDGMIDTLRDADRLGFGGRRERFAALIESTFDLEHVERFMLGKHARDMSPAERDTLRPLMFRFATSLLAQNLASDAGQRFEPRFARSLGDGRVRVRSDFHDGEGHRIDTDFIVQHGVGGWRIVDYWYAGISGMQIQRREFAAVMTGGGAPALIARLREKLAEMEARGAAR